MSKKTYINYRVIGTLIGHELNVDHGWNGFDGWVSVVILPLQGVHCGVVIYTQGAAHVP